MATLSAQRDKLSQALADIRTTHPGVIVDLVCHSQGCVVAALARPTGIRRTIFLAAPASLSRDRMVAVFGQRPGTSFDFTGMSQLQRRDGTTTIVPSAYWKSLEGLDLFSLYRQLATSTSLTLVNASDDEVIGKANFDPLIGQIEFVTQKANHDFTGSGRPIVASLVKDLLR